MSSWSSPTLDFMSTSKPDNFPDEVRKDLQRLLAVSAYDKVKNKDLSMSKQLKEIQTSYLGKNDVVGQVWKFMQQKESFYTSIVHRDDVHKTGQSSNLPFILNPKVSRSDSILILAENENVNTQILKRTYMSEPGELSGRTIMTMAKTALREAKKMVSQMNEAVNLGIVEIKDGEYNFNSGKNEDDLDNFVCFRMFNWKQIYGPSGGPPDLNNFDSAISVDTDISGEEFHNVVSSPVTDEEMANLPVPPKNFLPKGFFLFKARGPMAPKKDRFDLMDNGLAKEGGSRRHTRLEEKKEKDSARDFDADRGMALSGTYKDIAIIAQQKRKLDQNDHATDIARLTAALNSKNTRWKTTLETMKMLHDIGQEDAVTEMAKELPHLSAEVKALESRLEKLNDKAS